MCRSLRTFAAGRITSGVSLTGLTLLGLVGCMDQTPPPRPQPAAPVEVKEFDPKEGKQIVKPKAVVTDPITGPLEILRVQKINLPTLAIEHALNLFNASEGRYPNSLDEFMTRIVRENNIKLPQLPQGQEFEYDVANHKLVIVRTAEKKAP